MTRMPPVSRPTCDSSTRESFCPKENSQRIGRSTSRLAESVSRSLPLGQPHLPLIHPEVVGDLMPESVRDYPRDVARPTGGSFDRTLEQRDPVWHGEALERTSE